MEALRAFALVGLAGPAETRIASAMQAGQEWWVAWDGNGNRRELAENRREPIADFLAVASAWIRHRETDVRGAEEVERRSLEDLLQRIHAHPLLEALKNEGVVGEQFVGVVMGECLLRGEMS
jgi:hypothetical protein